ncbi:ATP-binding protein [Mycobacteroides chelonae]|nr:ATP-binding protein [Mycobacteroides chelonae]
MDTILRFWWAFELFSPQSIPDEGPGVIAWNSRQALPWTCAPATREGCLWEYTVYLGVYLNSWIYQHLEEAFQTGVESYAPRLPGQTACAAFLVDHDGYLVSDTVELSSAAWGLGKIRGAGMLAPTVLPQLLGTFPDVNAQFGREAAGLMYGATDGGGASPRPVAADDLKDLLGLAHDTAGITGTSVARQQIRIKCVQVKERKPEDEPPRTDFLNSLFLRELENTRHAVGRGDLGAALGSYLASEHQIQTGERRDVMDPDVITEIVARTNVEQMPWGRWPSDPAHPLALSQQFAVNEALATLSGATGLMGVNGPPGTGKTTMLREIIAANVVTRAQLLAELASPKQAFVSGSAGSWKSDSGYVNEVPRLRPELTGFEMVVASSNNTAVENISNELPADTAIHPRWRHEIPGYFRATATDVLQAADAGLRAQNMQAWALIAARLGKKENRQAFINAFWYGSANDPKGPAPTPIKDVLRHAKKAPTRTWGEAVSAFRSAQDRVEQLRAPRLAAQQRRDKFNTAQHEVSTANAAIASAEKLKGEHTGKYRAHMHSSGQAYTHARTLADELERHKQRRPCWWHNWTKGPQDKQRWEERKEELLKQIRAADARYAAQYRAAEPFGRAAVEQESVINRWKARKSAFERQITELVPAVHADEQLSGYPTQAWFADETSRECSAPWLDEDLDAARSELFIAALDLHQAFLENLAREGIGAQLSTAAAVAAGRAPRSLPAEAVTAAWQLFFLAVPVVSTTFASIRAMFGEMGRESLGWLFVDEAGQVKPQEAVGAIWRSRRVLVVGDPRQLQPVVTMPADAENIIARAFAVTDTWVPSRSSVQALADRTGRWGTELGGGTESRPPVWVSAPLRVHRRCDGPMFAICNRIAYDGIMIQGNNCTCDDLPASRWIDVPNPQWGKKVQDKEIDVLAQRIEALLTRPGIGTEDIFVVSPFKPVVARIKDDILERHPGMSGGTVHSVQGQQAKVVFLVLGGDPAKRGSKTWAGLEPNLINVAVSRAQHRFYVIGDKASWSKVGYFQYLSAELDRHSRANQRPV